jgi:hypothetical protein
MRDERRRRGFERAGSFRPERCGLPSAATRRLRLALAWRRVAGAVLARQAPALGVRRGVLEVAARDARWAETLNELLPELAARIAEAHPELRVRRCRVVTEEADGPRLGAVLPLGAVGPDRTPPPRAARSRVDARPPAGIPAAGSTPELRERLGELERRLSRQGGKRRAPQKP